MNNDRQFIAINFLDNNQKSLFEFPIIYYWDGNDDINDALKDKDFIYHISTKINKSNFYNVSIKRIYTYFDSEDNLKYQEDSICIKDIYDIETFNLDNEYLWEILNFLYKCAYKEDYKTKYDYLNVYKDLLKKYPKKINANTITNYIQAKLVETYPNIENSDIQKIIKKFYKEIENEQL